MHYLQNFQFIELFHYGAIVGATIGRPFILRIFSCGRPMAAPTGLYDKSEFVFLIVAVYGEKLCRNRFGGKDSCEKVGLGV